MKSVIEPKIFTRICRIEKAPGIDFEAGDGKCYFAALETQRAFVRNACHLLNSESDFTLEIRITNDITSRINKFYLMLKMESFNILNEEKFEEYCTNLDRMLPSDFLFVSVEEDDPMNVLCPTNKNTIVEIRRRPAMTAINNFQLHHNGTPILSPLNYMNRGIKIGGFALSDFSHSIPEIVRLGESTSNFYDVFRHLKETPDTVIVRIAVHIERVAPEEKLRATQAYQMLLESPLKSPDGRPAENDLLTSYYHYIQHEWLYGLNVQIAGSSSVTNTSIANRLIGEVVGKEGRHSSLHVNNLPTSETINRWNKMEVYYSAFPKEVCSRNPEDEFFLNRCLYLYTENEVCNFFKFPISDKKGLPGIVTKMRSPFYGTRQKRKEDNLISLAKPINRFSINGFSKNVNTGSLPEPYAISLNDITKHIFIAGTTGSGKTNTTQLLMHQLMEKEIPFLLLEPVKSEYFKKLEPHFLSQGKTLHRFQLNRPYRKDGSLDPTFLRINPLVPIEGRTITEHISGFKSAFMAAAPMEGIIPIIFEDFITQFYSSFANEKEMFDADYRLSYSAHDKIPLSVSSFSNYIETYFSDPRHKKAKSNNELEAMLSRRIVRLKEGILGQIFKPECCVDDQEIMTKNLNIILNRPCVVDLASLEDNEDKAFIVAIILVYLYGDRMKRTSHDPNNRLHITFVEEAHHLLPSNYSGTSGARNGSEALSASAKTASLFNNLLAEIRAKAEGIVLIEQSPEKISIDAIKNTNLKIMHRLSSASDRYVMGKAMSMTEEQIDYAGNLDPGEAIVFDDSINEPILVKMDLFKDDSQQ